MRLAPNSPDVLTTRGLVLFLSGKLPQALQHLQSALRLDPGHDSALQLRRRIKDVERLKEEGNQAFKVGSLQDAIDKYNASLEVCMLYRFVFCLILLFIKLYLSANWKQGGRR
jgi:DnaJ family protein C protein 7